MEKMNCMKSNSSCCVSIFSRSDDPLALPLLFVSLRNLCSGTIGKADIGLPGDTGRQAAVSGVSGAIPCGTRCVPPGTDSRSLPELKTRKLSGRSRKAFIQCPRPEAVPPLKRPLRRDRLRRPSAVPETPGGQAADPVSP